VPQIECIPGLSDHDIVYAEFDANPAFQRQVRRRVPQYSKADWPALRADAVALSDTVLQAFDDSSDTEQVWLTLKDGIATIIETHVLYKTLGGKNNKPWVDYATLKLIRRCDRLYKQWKKSGCPRLRSELKSLKRSVQCSLRRNYWAYTERLFSDTDEERLGSNKRFWTYIKTQCTEAASVSPLKVDGKLVTGAKERAEALNSQFQSAFSPKISCTAEEFSDRTDLSPHPPAQSPTISDINITVPGVTKLLKDLDPSKASGPDGISPRILKELADELSPAMTLLFRCSLATGVVPADWRTANVTPVFKKGERYKPENYRPISLTSVPCKILEHIITSSVMSFAEDNGIITEAQHGFRRQHSSESQLLGLVDELSDDLEKGKQSDALIMDFSKAFDRVCHSLLIHKLRHLGITGKVLD
jgi:hypothetical protein